MDVKLITMSSKGQIAIPAGIRRKLNLREGQKLLVFVDSGLLLIKPVEIPGEEELKEELRNKAGLLGEDGELPEDIEREILEMSR